LSLIPPPKANRATAMPGNPMDSMASVTSGVITPRFSARKDGKGSSFLTVLKKSSEGTGFHVPLSAVLSP